MAHSAAQYRLAAVRLPRWYCRATILAVFNVGGRTVRYVWLICVLHLQLDAGDQSSLAGCQTPGGWIVAGDWWLVVGLHNHHLLSRQTAICR